MPRFRMHRGGLSESLATTFEFERRSELVSRILDVWPELRSEKFNLECKPYGGDDDRIGWHDVHIVTAKGNGVIGFIEGQLPPE